MTGQRKATAGRDFAIRRWMLSALVPADILAFEDPALGELICSYFGIGLSESGLVAIPGGMRSDTDLAEALSVNRQAIAQRVNSTLRALMSRCLERGEAAFPRELTDRVMNTSLLRPQR